MQARFTVLLCLGRCNGPMIQTLKLKDVLSSERVLLNAPLSSTQQAFDTLAQLACGATGPKAAEVSRRLWGRERHGSTALGYGVAIPHAQIIGLRRPVASFLRSTGPLSFDAPDGRPVFDLLAIFVPKPAVPCHFALLEDARRLLRDADFRQALAGCRDAHDVWQLFERWPFHRSLLAPGSAPGQPLSARMQQSSATP